MSFNRQVRRRFSFGTRRFPITNQRCRCQKPEARVSCCYQSGHVSRRCWRCNGYITGVAS